MKKLTKKQREKLKIDEALYAWWIKNCIGLSAIDQIRRFMEDDCPNMYWANEFIVGEMTRDQFIAYAIYAAEQVEDLFIKCRPDDPRVYNVISTLKDVADKVEFWPNMLARLRACEIAGLSKESKDPAFVFPAMALATAAASIIIPSGGLEDGPSNATMAATAAACAAGRAAGTPDEMDIPAFKKMRDKILEYGISLLEGK